MYQVFSRLMALRVNDTVGSAVARATTRESFRPSRWSSDAFAIVDVIHEKSCMGWPRYAACECG